MRRTRARRLSSLFLCFRLLIALTSSLVGYVYILIPIANFVNSFLLPLPTFFLTLKFKAIIIKMKGGMTDEEKNINS